MMISTAAYIPKLNENHKVLKEKSAEKGAGFRVGVLTSFVYVTYL
jgi:hypothetical protein